MPAQTPPANRQGTAPAITAPAITALILCGGRGSRMGGIDKGLQPFGGTPLALLALERLRRQSLPPAHIHISANRHHGTYAAWGVPVWGDGVPGFAGPLAGMLAGMRHCRTPWLLTVPCDVPFFPLTLGQRLAQALLEQPTANIATAAVRTDGAANADAHSATWRAQPVFSLLRCLPDAQSPDQAPLADTLAQYLQSGGRKAGEWLAAQRQVLVPFDAHGEDGCLPAFANANTTDELHRLQALQAGAGAASAHAGGTKPA